MSDAVFISSVYDKRKPNASAKTICVIDNFTTTVKHARMLNPQEILEAVGAKDTKTGIANVLGLPAPRITELYKGDRKLSAEEAKKLYDHYKLDHAEEISLAMCRLLVTHCLGRFGLEPEDQKIQEVALDFRAFLKFASNPDVQDSLAAGFLAGISATHDDRSLPILEH